MPCPNTKDFSAWINLMPGSNPTLIVKGKVETTSGSLQPQLEKAEPQGINPKILLLNLTIVDSGKFGTADVNYRDVRHEEPAVKDQYTDVEVIFEGNSCVSLKVTETN